MQDVAKDEERVVVKVYFKKLVLAYHICREVADRLRLGFHRLL